MDENASSDTDHDEDKELTIREKLVKASLYALKCKCLKGATIADYLELTLILQIFVQNILDLLFANKVDAELYDIMSADRYVEISGLYVLYYAIFWISTSAQVFILITIFKVMVTWMPDRFSIFLSLVS